MNRTPSPYTRPSRESVFTRLSLALLVAVALFMFASCGGGGGGSVVTPPPAPAPAFLQITTTMLPNATAGQPYNFTMQASGGTPPYTWSMEPGWVMPAGLSLSSAGVISGTLSTTQCLNTCPGNTRVVVRDTASRSANAMISFTVIVPLVVPPTALPQANIGVPFSQVIPVQGGTWPVTAVLAPGSAPLPQGLSINAGRLEGTPGVFGNFSFAVQATDSATPPNVATGTDTLQITNNLWITTFGLPLGVVGQPYQHTLQAVGGTPPYSWALGMFSSQLPPGLSLNGSTGAISGTPTQAAQPDMWFQATDSSSPAQTITRNVGRLNVNPPLFFVTPGRLPDGVENRGYSAGVTLAGGRLPYSIRVASGSLPPGTNLNTVGLAQGTVQVQGTPSMVGAFTFDLEATDSSSPPALVTLNHSLRVNTQLLMSASIPDGLEGQSYSASLGASGGVPPYNWRIYTCFSSAYTGCIPGVTLDAVTGQFTGTPSLGVTAQVTFEVQDSSIPPQSATGGRQVTIFGLLRATSVLPTLRVGAPVFLQLGATGGVPPLTWSVSSGALPAGLSFDSASLQITGTPTMPETQTITLQVRDSGTSFPQTVQQPLTLVVAVAPGRNDTLATATPLSSGRYSASLSPGDDGTSFSPDTDYYRISANPQATVVIETFAERLSLASPMDSVIEILDSAGTRFNLCGPYLGAGFFQPCVNDDAVLLNTLDSKLYFLVPGTSGTPTTFYVRVLDWSGNARPDFRYEISINGAN